MARASACAWLVLASLACARAERDASADAPPPRSRSGLDVEIAGGPVFLLTGTQRVFLTGSCTTATGAADVAVYGRYTDTRGSGAGLGVSGRVEWVERWAPRGSRGTTFLGLRAGPGLELDVLWTRTVVGYAPEAGDTCAHVAVKTLTIERRGVPTFAARLPLETGVELGLGGVGDRAAVLALSWAPAVVLLAPSFGGPGLHVAWLGGRASLDLAPSRLDPGAPRLRAAVSLAAATVAGDPTLGSATLGLAW